MTGADDGLLSGLTGDELELVRTLLRRIEQSREVNEAEGPVEVPEPKLGNYINFRFMPDGRMRFYGAEADYFTTHGAPVEEFRALVERFFEQHIDPEPITKRVRRRKT